MRMRARGVAGFLEELRDERIALVDQFLARTPAVLRSDRVLAKQRKRDRRIAVRDDRIRQNARIHFSPADSLRWRRAGQSTPDDLVRGQLDEVVVAPFRNPVHLPERRLTLKVEILR